MPSYEQSKTSKLWSVRFRETHADGSEHQRRLSGYKTKKSAQYGYEEYLRQKALEPKETPAEADPNDILFEVLLEKYYNYRRSRLKPASLYDIQKKMDKQILPTFKGKKIKDIKPIDVLEWQNRIVTAYSANYSSALMTLLRSLYTYGEKYHDIKNIMSKVDMPRSTKPKAEMQCWSLDEYEQFASEVNDPTYKVFFMLLFFLGFRRGEAEALTWGDINFTTSTIKISKSITKKATTGKPWEVTTPKNAGSNRTVNMPPAIAYALLKYKRLQAKECTRAQFVFGGDRPLAPTTTDKVFKNTCERAGVKKIRIHDLRHSCASLLISKGVSIVAVSKLLGHTDVHMTLNTYAHMLEDDKSKMLCVLETALTADKAVIQM